MPYNYDDQNIFAKILRGEIPCNKVLETEHSLAFHDINPAAPKHVLVIPKGSYVTYDHFAQIASSEEITDFVRAIGKVCKKPSSIPVTTCSTARTTPTLLPKFIRLWDHPSFIGQTMPRVFGSSM